MSDFFIVKNLIEQVQNPAKITISLLFRTCFICFEKDFATFMSLHLKQACKIDLQKRYETSSNHEQRILLVLIFSAVKICDENDFNNQTL